MFLPSLSTPPAARIVEFSAPCPACGADAAWSETLPAYAGPEAVVGRIECSGCRSV